MAFPAFGNSIYGSNPEKRIVTIAFVALVPILFLQIPLRHLYDIEPYPAILFPAGASKIEDRGFVVLVQRRLEAVAADGKRFEVGVHDLLSTVPRQYRQPIVKRRFGLSTNRRDRKESASEAVISEGRVWLKRRLRTNLGEREFVELEIVTSRVFIPTGGFSPYSETTLDRSTIQLQ